MSHRFICVHLEDSLAIKPCIVKQIPGIAEVFNFHSVQDIFKEQVASVLYGMGGGILGVRQTDAVRSCTLCVLLSHAQLLRTVM